VRAPASTRSRSGRSCVRGRRPPLIYVEKVFTGRAVGAVQEGVKHELSAYGRCMATAGGECAHQVAVDVAAAVLAATSGRNV
jgi:hypothetical protein